MNMQQNKSTGDNPQRQEGQPRPPAMVDPPAPGAQPSSPTRKPSETPRQPNEQPGAPPREVPRQPMPTEQDRERAENEGMIAP